MTDTLTVEAYALALWQNASDDEIWDACFRWGRDVPELVYSEPDAYPAGERPGLIDVAGELLERMVATEFAVGDMTHDECVAALLRRHPLLGPAPRV